MADYWSYWMDISAPSTTAPHLWRQLVPQGSGRQVRVARLRRKRPHPQVDRRQVHERLYAEESPLGWVPATKTSTGPASTLRKQFDEIMSVDRANWEAEILSHEELFIKLYDRLPKEFMLMRQLVLSSLWRAPEHWEPTHVTAPYVQ